MMRSIVLALCLSVAGVAQAQTVSLLKVAGPVTLTGGQSTQLGSLISAQWPTIALAKALHLHAEYRAGVVWSGLRYSGALDQPTLFTLLNAGVAVSVGQSSTETAIDTGLVQISGAASSALGTFVTSVFGVAGSSARVLDCDQVAGAGVTCSIVYVQTYTAAQAWSAYQALTAGQALVPGS